MTFILTRSRRRAAFMSALAVVLAASFAWAGIRDRDVDSTGPDFTKKTLVLHFQGQYTTNTTAAVKWAIAEDWKILKVFQVARAKSGTVTVDVLDDAVSIFSAPGPVTTSVVDDSALFTAPKLASSGSIMSINLAVGTSVDDLTVTIVYRSKVATE